MTIDFIQEQLTYPDWYIRLEDYLRNEILPVIHDDPVQESRRAEFYLQITRMLEAGLIPLAQNGPDMDASRIPIDTLVIHHSETDPDVSLSGLSAIGFVRQYALNYLNDDVWGHSGLRGKPIWSGHYRDGKMVFFAYHWLIRPDGSAERLLEDSYVGHHSLETNSRSIALCFSGNYEHSTPPLSQIQGAARIIRDEYDYIDRTRIVGHCEVMENRTCPGDMFIPKWKQVLISQI